MVARPFVVDPVLTALSLSYRNDSSTLVADVAMPRVPVTGEDFAWTRFPIAEPFTVPRTEVGRRGRVERVEFNAYKDSSSTRDYGLEDSIPISDINAASVQRARGLGTFSPVDHATQMLTDILLLDREIRVAGMMQDPSNYASNKRLVLSGSDQFSNPSSNIIGTLKAAFNSTLIYRPNTMTMGRSTWSVVSSHPQIVNAIRGNVTSQGIVTPEEFLQLFSGEGLKTLAIGEAFLNVARRGQDAKIQRVWGNHIMLTHVNPMANPISGGVTFAFTAQCGRRFAGQWEERDVGLEGGHVVRVGEKVRELIVAPDVGVLIQNAVSNTDTPTIVPAAA